MSTYEVSDYGIFSDGIASTNSLNDSFKTASDDMNTAATVIKDDSVFMGPAADECRTQVEKINTLFTASVENFSTLSSYLAQSSGNYKAGDDAASKTVTDSTDTATDGTSVNVNSQSTDKKNIDTSNIQAGTNVYNAVNKYSSELENAEYATVNSNIFTTTTTENINGQPVKVTHVVINNGSQINGAPANGSYGSGLEKASSAGARLGSSILINGSHFDYGSGKEDLKGANNIVIVNGQVKKDGVSGGNELLLDSSGNIYNASGKTATQLVNDGVKYSFSCHSTQVIVNGDTSPSYREGRSYKRNVIGQVGAGEYYIITDTNYNNKLSATAEYLKSKGVKNAYSLDQGGSVSLVRGSTLINNPSDDEGERSVGDFLYFT